MLSTSKVASLLVLLLCTMWLDSFVRHGAVLVEETLTTSSIEISNALDGSDYSKYSDDKSRVVNHSSIRCCSLLSNVLEALRCLNTSASSTRSVKNIKTGGFSNNTDGNSAHTICYATYVSPEIYAYAIGNLLYNMRYMELQQHPFRVLSPDTGDNHYPEDPRWNKIRAIPQALRAHSTNNSTSSSTSTSTSTNNNSNNSSDSGWAQNCSHLVFIDADLLVLDWTGFRIQSVIDQHPRAHLLLAADSLDIGNTGMLVVRNSAWSIAFFDAWWAARFTPNTFCDQHVFNKLYQQRQKGGKEGTNEMNSESDFIRLLTPKEINSVFPAIKNFEASDPILHLMGETIETRIAVANYASQALCDAHFSRHNGDTQNSSNNIHVTKTGHGEARDTVDDNNIYDTTTTTTHNNNNDAPSPAEALLFTPALLKNLKMNTMRTNWQQSLAKCESIVSQLINRNHSTSQADRETNTASYTTTTATTSSSTVGVESFHLKAKMAFERMRECAGQMCDPIKQIEVLIPGSGSGASVRNSTHARSSRNSNTSNSDKSSNSSSSSLDDLYVVDLTGECVAMMDRVHTLNQQAAQVYHHAIAASSAEIPIPDEVSGSAGDRSSTRLEMVLFHTHQLAMLRFDKFLLICHSNVPLAKDVTRSSSSSSSSSNGGIDSSLASCAAAGSLVLDALDALSGVMDMEVLSNRAYWHHKRGVVFASLSEHLQRKRKLIHDDENHINTSRHTAVRTGGEGGQKAVEDLTTASDSASAIADNARPRSSTASSSTGSSTDRSSSSSDAEGHLPSTWYWSESLEREKVAITELGTALGYLHQLQQQRGGQPQSRQKGSSKNNDKNNDHNNNDDNNSNNNNNNGEGNEHDMRMSAGDDGGDFGFKAMVLDYVHSSARLASAFLGLATNTAAATTTSRSSTTATGTNSSSEQHARDALEWALIGLNNLRKLYQPSSKGTAATAASLGVAEFASHTEERLMLQELTRMHALCASIYAHMSHPDKQREHLLHIQHLKHRLALTHSSS